MNIKREKKRSINIKISEAHYQYLLELQKANDGMSLSRLISQIIWFYKIM